MSIDVNETAGLSIVVAAALGAVAYDRFLYRQVKKLINTSTGEDSKSEMSTKNTYEYLVASQAVAKIVKSQMESMSNMFATAEQAPPLEGESEPRAEGDGVYL